MTNEKAFNIPYIQNSTLDLKIKSFIKNKDFPIAKCPPYLWVCDCYKAKNHKLVIFANKILKIFTIFLNIVVLFKEFETTLSIIVFYLSFIEVTSYLGLKQNIENIDHIFKYFVFLFMEFGTTLSIIVLYLSLIEVTSF